MNYKLALKRLQPGKKFFIGIDSDGCVFDTMEIKQKKFFIPNALKYFDLDAISDLLIETWEFVNLYSVHRGGNRFTSLIKVFDLLKQRKAFQNSGVILPDCEPLRRWTVDETRLSNSNLEKYLVENRDPGLEKILQWSKAINSDIAENLHSIAPFTYASKVIKDISCIADMVIVSQTPLEALDREWEENELSKFVRLIAGQEHGTKNEQLFYAASGKYPSDRILMIGDAIGDLEAARQNNILFYPVIPGKENDSWKRFLIEGMGKFVKGTYSGSYESSLLSEFEKCLPSIPFWQQ